MVIYGLITFLSYSACIVIQNMLFDRFFRWSIKLEILIYFILYLIALPFTVLYYKSDIVNGDYSVIRFILEQYIPILIIITPIMFLLRKFVSKNGRSISRKEGVVVLKGENRDDILRIRPEAIVSVSSSDNYVEVGYLDQKILRKKLLRMTLKKVELEFDFLIRSHRSHLINPIHFVEWVGKDTIKLNQIEIPVSKQYKSLIENLIQP